LRWLLAISAGGGVGGLALQMKLLLRIEYFAEILQGAERTQFIDFGF